MQDSGQETTCDKRSGRLFVGRQAGRWLAALPIRLDDPTFLRARAPGNDKTSFVRIGLTACQIWARRAAQ